MSLAPYACDPALSRGRRYPEPAAPTRSEFQRDRDRIVHSTAFRRLVYKTQVFLNHEGDLFRTRLTHSLEVAQLGRSIARSLRLNEDLVEAIALAHDLGHTPFGHAGQDALHECMREHGGFEHNLQSLRRMLSQQVYDVIAATGAALAAAKPDSADAVRHAQTLVRFTPPMREESTQLKRFLFSQLYRHPQVMDTTDRARQVVQELFAA